MLYLQSPGAIEENHVNLGRAGLLSDLLTRGFWNTKYVFIAWYLVKHRDNFTFQIT